MLNDFKVKVYVGGTTDIPSIGLVSGVCTWETSNQSQSILAEEYVSTIDDSVDISVSGNYARYSDCVVSIMKSAIVEQTLSNNGLTLTGKLIELIETDGVTEEITRRGVVKNVVCNGNNYDITVSHLANYYNTPMTPRIGENNSSLVYGDSVDYVQLIYEASTASVTTIGDNLTPFFIVLENESNGLRIRFRTAYDKTILDSSDVTSFLNASDYFVVEGREKLVVESDSLIYTVAEGGKEYWGVNLDVIPTNRKKGDYTNYIEDGSTVKFVASGYDKYWIPYGSTPNFKNLTYGSDNRPFPQYVDSRVDYAGRIEILDADSTGDLLILPSNRYEYGIGSVDYETVGQLDEGDLVSRGVYGQASSGGSLTFGTITYSGEELMDDVRDDDLGGEVNIPFEGSAGLIEVVKTYTFNPKDIDSTEVYFTAVTKIVDNSGQAVDSEVVSKLFVTTIGGLYGIYTRGNDTLPNYTGYTFQNPLPETLTKGSNSNLRYRWENTTIFGNGEIGETIPLLDQVLEDYEKEVDISVTSITQFWGVTGGVGAGQFIEMSDRTNLVAPVQYDRGNLKMSGVSGREDSNGFPIETTNAAYISCLELQNYSLFGIDTPSLGWGLEYPVMDFNTVIDPIISVRSYELDYSTEDTETNLVKYDMLKYTCGIGTINIDGLETWKSTAEMYTGGFQFNKHNIIGQPTITEIDPTRIYPEISIEYSGGIISITNADQPVYDPSYVTGVTLDSDKEALWSCAFLLFQKYKVKNSYPKKLSDVKGIRDEADAIDHIFRQYQLWGAVRSGDEAVLYRRYRAQYLTGIDIVYGESFEIGKPITLDYPNIATVNKGLVTGYSRNNVAGTISVTAECAGEIIASSESIIIDESGDRDTDIDEAGNRDTNYVEGV